MSPIIKDIQPNAKKSGKQPRKEILDQINNKKQKKSNTKK
jgi:hypothetical protein